MKKCCTCKIIKNENNFYVNQSRPDGYNSKCKDCMSIYVKEYRKLHPETHKKASKKYRDKTFNKRQKYNTEWYKNNPDIAKNSRLKRKFGITLEQYNELVKSQNNICAICKEPEHRINNKSGKIKALAVDHDHATGRIRGLLCHDCNVSIGLLKENVSILLSAIEYIKS